MKKTTLPLLILLLVLCLSACAREEAEPARCAFGVVSTDNKGNAWSEAVHGYYAPGTVITAHAVPSDGSSFYAWSAGAPLESGGILLSYDRDYTFSLASDLWLYPNYRENSSALVLYHANGGTILDEGSPDGDALWKEFSLAYYLYPNALAELGYFARDGFTLIGYSTMPDGSGEFYAPGAKIFEDTDSVIELWCVWSEQSPTDDFSFSFDASAGGWAVDAYRGPGGEVSVPSSFEGYPVRRIAPGAFAGSAAITRLILPPSLRVIGDGSCSGMTNLASLVFFDSLDYISDAAFAGDSTLDTVYICAATKPRYCNWFNNHAKKIELMNYWKDDERPMFVILGGSSAAYAVNAQQLQSLLSREYVVLNCGTNGANLFDMSSVWAMRFMEDGDFLLHLTEYSGWQLGGTQCAWETFRSFESCYNVFSWVPISRYDQFFDCFNKYLEARSSLPEAEYEDYVSYLAGTAGYYDEQGTLTLQTAPNGSETFWQGRRIYFCGEWLYPYMVDNLNERYAQLDGMGVDAALTYTPLNRNSLYPEQTAEHMDDFEAYLSDNLNITILGELRENLMDPAILYDDDYHLASPARAEFTERLAGEINEYFSALDSEAAD